METPPADLAASTVDAPPSLLPLRVAALVGFFATAAATAYGFAMAWWLGVIGLLALPLIPLLCVLGIERVLGPRS